ncbi:MAG: sigma-70 family RNA polymerase sigma factor [Dehalococcoidia bacterium]|nr:sigma-70 family RNA polymerase sigma factor [Dehalococcoidia bacterium]
MGGPEDASAEFVALIERARAYDRDAFGELYRRSLGSVFRYCRSRVDSTAEAEELTQDVFMAALAGIQSVRADREAAWLAWLFQVARHKHADALRRRYRRPQAPLEAAGDAPDGAPQPLAEVVAQDERAEVRRALEQLTDEQREVIVCKYVLGYDNERTAAVVGKNSNAVNQLHHRAVARLRRLLAAREVVR